MINTGLVTDGLSEEDVSMGLRSIGQKRRHLSILLAAGASVLVALAIMSYNFLVVFFSTTSLVNHLLAGVAALLGVISAGLMRWSARVAPGVLAKPFREIVEGGGKERSRIRRVLVAMDLTGIFLICGDVVEKDRTARIEAMPE